MEFIYPIWLITLISIPIVIFFLFISKKPRKITVPSLLIWKKVFESDNLSRSKKSKIDLFLLLIIFVMFFIILSIAKLSISYSKLEPLHISIFIDDSDLMNNKVSIGTNAIEFCRETIINNLYSKVNRNAKFNVYSPIANVYERNMDLSQLKIHLDTIKTAGFINYNDYTLRLNSFIHDSSEDSSSIAIIFTPYQINNEISNFKHISIVNPTFTEIPIFPEFLGFESDSILVRINRVCESNCMLKVIDNVGEKEIINTLNKNAIILNDITSEYGVVTTGSNINKYFTTNPIFKIGAVGFESDFIVFFNNIFSYVKLFNFTEFQKIVDIDAWLIAENTEIPENYHKPIIYFAGANDRKWFDVKNIIKLVEPLKVSTNKLLKGVSVSELDFSNAKQIELKSAKWYEQIILSESNTLVGILNNNNSLRAIINSGAPNKNNTSMIMLIMNLLEYMCDDNLISRSKYTSCSIDDFINKVNSVNIQSNTKLLDITVHKFINGLWIEKQIPIKIIKSINELKLMLNSGAIISFNKKYYAVNPDLSDITVNLANNKILNIDDAINKIIKEISAKKHKSYFELDSFLILLSIIALLLIIYYKPRNPS